MFLGMSGSPRGIVTSLLPVLKCLSSFSIFPLEIIKGPPAMKSSARLIISCRDLNSTLFFLCEWQTRSPNSSFVHEETSLPPRIPLYFSMLSSSKGLGDFHRIR